MLTIAAKPAPILTPIGISPLDDPKAWLKYDAFEPPLSTGEIDNVQREIDSICGVTRENKSIIKLAWNGDRRYWKEFHNKWDTEGRPVGNLYRRPQVLYMSIFAGQSEDAPLLRDAFPPRWLLFTRIEAEQYADGWGQESQFFCPDRKKYIQILPSAAPKERYIWYQTISVHNGLCCQVAAKNDHDCYGKYTHPRFCLNQLRIQRRSMELDGVWDKGSPFDAPDELARRLRERSTNNYAEQAVRQFSAFQQEMVDDTPLVAASPHDLEGSISLRSLRKRLVEGAKRRMAAFEKELKTRRLN